MEAYIFYGLFSILLGLALTSVSFAIIDKWYGGNWK